MDRINRLRNSLIGILHLLDEENMLDPLTDPLDDQTRKIKTAVTAHPCQLIRQWTDIYRTGIYDVKAFLQVSLICVSVIGHGNLNCGIAELLEYSRQVLISIFTEQNIRWKNYASFCGKFSGQQARQGTACFPGI